jgi:hypothetical protein
MAVLAWHWVYRISLEELRSNIKNTNLVLYKRLGQLP